MSEKQEAPERVWLPDGVVQLARLSPELENVAGAYYVLKADLDKAVAETRRDVWEKAIVALYAQVTIEEGNTEINEAYFEVCYLGRELWHMGGGRKEVVKAANSFASKYRRKIAAALETVRDAEQREGE